jgi:hypothetical protein
MSKPLIVAMTLVFLGAVSVFAQQGNAPAATPALRTPARAGRRCSFGRSGSRRRPAARIPLQRSQRYYSPRGANVGRTSDVSPDGQRFLMIKPPGAAATIAQPSLIVVQHFDEELKRLLPTR